LSLQNLFHCIPLSTHRSRIIQLSVDDWIFSFLPGSTGLFNLYLIYLSRRCGSVPIRIQL
jgi:hypothetical protein